MSQKFFAQNSEIVNIPSLPPVNRRPLVLIAVATILVLALAFVVAGIAPKSNEAANTDQSSVIPYGNALELQYAHPFLSEQASAVRVPYGNALELQYAHPFLSGQEAAALDVPFSDALQMQYAQPWLNSQNAAAHIVPSGSPLERQYAQPWMTAQADEPAAYGNALEMQYAQPHLNK